MKMLKGLCIGMLTFFCLRSASESTGETNSPGGFLERAVGLVGQWGNFSFFSADPAETEQISEASAPFSKLLYWPLCILSRNSETGCSCCVPAEQERGKKPSKKQDKWVGDIWEKTERTTSYLGCCGQERSEYQRVPKDKDFLVLQKATMVLNYNCCGLCQEIAYQKRIEGTGEKVQEFEVCCVAGIWSQMGLQTLSSEETNKDCCCCFGGLCVGTCCCSSLCGGEE